LGRMEGGWIIIAERRERRLGLLRPGRAGR